MAKSTKTNASTNRNNASYSDSNEESQEASTLNPSKYAPTKDALMDLKQLGPEDGLLKLLEDSVKDIYWAENALLIALPKMAKAANASSLVDAILSHLEQTKTHVDRLKLVFDMLGRKPQAIKCDAMEGLMKEGESVIEDTDAETPARDLGIIMASQKVEHYEISSYTGIIKLALKLGHTDVADMLTQTLEEETASEALLADIADTKISFSTEETA